MNAPLPGEPVREFTFTEDQFSTVARIAHDNYGLDLQPAKRSLVYSRLTRRLRALRLPDFQDYIELITGPDGDRERAEMLSALTTNVTHFFREKHHFDLLAKSVLPAAIASAKSGGRVRLWSAACSAGQEPYSMAATILSLCPEAGRYDIRILATDVDPAILERAKAGVYPEEEIEAIPQPMRKDLVAAGPRTGTFSIGTQARSMVHFGQLNLVKDWPVRGPFQAIFCRNVAIYFDKETQARLWARFAPLLAPGAMLFIGHSERVSGSAASAFRSAGITAYERLARSGTGHSLSENTQ